MDDLFQHLLGLGVVGEKIPPHAYTVADAVKEFTGGRADDIQRARICRILLQAFRDGKLNRARRGREYYYWPKEETDAKAKATPRASRS